MAVFRSATSRTFFFAILTGAKELRSKMWKFLPYEGKIPPWGGYHPRLETTDITIALNTFKMASHSKSIS